MHRALSGLVGTEELIEYESRVNGVWDESQDRLVCVHDLQRIWGRVLLDIPCTHPKVILGGKVAENQDCMPPREFLASYRKRQAQPTVKTKIA